MGEGISSIYNYHLETTCYNECMRTWVSSCINKLPRIYHKTHIDKREVNPTSNEEPTNSSLRSDWKPTPIGWVERAWEVKQL